jgi:glycosyltransferase involved in cell wall biosynthesis
MKGIRIGLRTTHGTAQVFPPAKAIDIDLDEPLRDQYIGPGYRSAHAAVRAGGHILGQVAIPLCREGYLRAVLAREKIIAELEEALTRQCWRRELLSIANAEEAMPFISVVVCSRDRPDALEACLRRIFACDYPRREIIVVDNAPGDERARRMIAEHFPQARYHREPLPGLNWARNRGVDIAEGEIIAFTDDDVLVAPDWLRTLASAFDDPDVDAVTGLILPAELDTEAQALFELLGGFEKGYQRRWFHVGARNIWGKTFHLGAGDFGAGANMAFRRSVFTEALGFDPALDVGTVTLGGGDLEFFFRVVQCGAQITYEPNAIVRHCHRREEAALLRQVEAWSTAVPAYLYRSARQFPRLAVAAKQTARWWKAYNRRFLWRARLSPGFVPRRYLRAALLDWKKGVKAYQEAERNVQALIARYCPEEGLSLRTWRAFQAGELPPGKLAAPDTTLSENFVMDIDEGAPALPEARRYHMVNLVPRDAGRALGHIPLRNDGLPLSAARVAEITVEEIFRQMKKDKSESLCWRGRTLPEWKQAARETVRIEPAAQAAPPFAPKVSIVIATFDRPESLRECLDSILRQRTALDYEVVVVDNHPASGKSTFVEGYHPRVRYVSETRQGLSFARNTGFRAAGGEILVCTDDDTEVREDWLDRIVPHFAREDVMAVAGNVFPYRLDNAAQQLFESYGGLGKGAVPRKYGPAFLLESWARPAPTWQIGATANAAFRRAAIEDPAIGDMLEYLGAGTPAGCSEDNYLFFRILKAGYTIVYDPGAYVLHKHRDSERAFRKQLFNYSKGHVAFLLVSMFRDGDWRALYRLGVEIPWWHLARLIGWKVPSGYPRTYVLLEMWGNALGPAALLWSMIKTRGARRKEARDRQAGLALPETAKKKG